MENNSPKSYLSQVRYLRKVATAALKMYSIEVLKLKFINHGENTTYKIISKQGNFLLRIHRKNYHSKNAILEELEWLRQLSENTDLIQKPLASIKDLLVEEITIDGPSDSRFCSVLTWVEGQMKYRSLSQDSMFKAGQLAGKLHSSASKLKVKHRNYWSPEGLLGSHAKLGSIRHLKSLIKKEEYEVLEECRKLTLDKIENYTSRNPHKSTMIHADLHFGNIIWTKNQAIPIDFDDCGFGPHMYDLMIIAGLSDNLFKSSPKKIKKLFIESLLKGYSSIQNLSKDDLDILPYFKLTRQLAMTGWAYERRDNPYIFDHLKKKLKTDIPYFDKVLKKGPDTLY